MRAVLSSNDRGRGRGNLRSGLHIVELDESLTAPDESAFAYRNPKDAPTYLRAEIALIAFEPTAHGQLCRWRSRKQRAHDENADYRQHH
jgi:hypothetical protein